MGASNMSRKDDHVRLSQDILKVASNDFDKVRFIHHGIPSISMGDVDYSTSFEGIQCEVPFFINAMTGGSEWTKSINQQLAKVAHATGLMMATGSMSAALKDNSLLDSFLIIRKENPKGIVLANLQASASLDSINQVINWIGADAIQLHINSAQELLMPEGDRDFTGWLDNIKHVARTIDVPLIVKEVGFGFSKETIQQLMHASVTIIDISGNGGTNFASIENARSERPMDYMSNWGQSTVVSLLEAQDVIKRINIIASGGIRNMLDVAKALALGAKAVGISGHILNLVLNEGVDETILIINQYKQELKKIMVLLDVKNISEFLHTDLIFDEALCFYAHQRNLDVTRYHQRKGGK
jgi:isopentenyl-diphosphate delta-isomerase